MVTKKLGRNQAFEVSDIGIYSLIDYYISANTDPKKKNSVKFPDKPWDAFNEKNLKVKESDEADKGMTIEKYEKLQKLKEKSYKKIDTPVINEEINLFSDKDSHEGKLKSDEWNEI